MTIPDEMLLDLIERLIAVPAGPATNTTRYALAGQLLPMLMQFDRKAVMSDPAARDELGTLLGTCGIAFFDYYDQFGDPSAASAARSAFDACFDLWTQQNSPDSWALTHLNLATLLYRRGERLTGEDAVAVLEDAVRGYGRSLEVWDEQTAAKDWALCQMNRANALQGVAIRTPGDRGLMLLEEALAGYECSLRVRTRRRDKVGWAACQMNCGNTHARIGDRTPGEAGLESLRRAIHRYDQALEVRDPNSSPLEWAAVHMNRANALMSLGERTPDKDGLKLLRDALRSYDLSLTKRPSAVVPILHASTQMNRGTVLQSLGDRTPGVDGIKHLRGADAAYAIAEAGLESQGDLFASTTCRINRANAMLKLADRIPGPEGERLLETAVQIFDVNLARFPKETAPIEWAKAMLNAAIALQLLARRSPDDKRAARHAASTEAAAVAMAFYREIGDADLELGAARILTAGAVQLGDWELARTAAQTVMDRGLLALSSAETSADRDDILGRLEGMADRLAFALARQGDYAAAIGAAARGRATGLRQRLRERASVLSPAVADVLSVARGAALAARAAYAQIPPSVSARYRGAALTELKTANAAYWDILSQVDAQSPVTDDDAWRRAARSGGCIVTIVVTEAGSALLIAPENIGALSEQHAIILPEFTRFTLRDLCVREPRSGWLWEYEAYGRDLATTHNHGTAAGFSRWNSFLENLLETLWHELMAPLHERLSDIGLTLGAPVTLLAPGLLANLPIHAAGLKVEGKWRCFCDNWSVSYAPSLSVLVTPTAQTPLREPRLLAVSPSGPGLGGLENPATPYFERVQVLRGEEATVTAVSEALAEADYASFLCHGTWDPEHPDRSGLALADGQVLKVSDLRGLNTPIASTIALAACETALSDIGPLRNELNGLPAALLEAGAERVVAALWPVFSHAATATLRDFFRVHRRQGLEPAAALRQSVLDLRERREESDASSLRALASPEPTRPTLGTLIFGGLSERRERHDADRRAILSDLSNPIHWAAFTHHGR